MSSINLLPKNIIIKEDSAKRKRDVFLISFFMLSVSVIAYTIIHTNRVNAIKELSYVDLRLEELDKDIKKELNKNKFPIKESKIKDAVILLNNHNYYSKALKTIQNIINNDVYLVSGGFSFGNEENLTFSFSGFAKNYMAAMEQIAVLKDSFWINKVNVYNFSSGEGEEVQFEGDVILDKDIISYSDNYWDFGLALLSSRTDRFLKIENYSANLIKTTDKKNVIEIEFNGIAYEEEKLALLEDDLKEIKPFVIDALVFYDSNKEQESGFIEFEGNMKLSF
ncbi:hypothetical protein KAT63_00010 [Candidatus Parcubacteria bacterium]|nr:hypothetical protein [Candidatus Parcubacteria bacterium]